MRRTYNLYTKNTITYARPYEVNETLPSNVSISEADRLNGSPKLGDMIAVNIKNPNDMWLIAADYFNDNFSQFPGSVEV